LGLAACTAAVPAPASTVTSFGTFTQAKVVPVVPFSYVGDTGFDQSRLSTPVSLPGSFAFNSAAFTNPGSVPTSPFDNVRLIFSAATTAALSVDTQTGIATQVFDASLPSGMVITDHNGIALFTVRSFSGSLVGVLGSSTATFNGQVTIDPAHVQTSLDLSFGAGTLSFTVELTSISPLLSINPVGKPVFTNFGADDPTSFATSGTVTFGPAAVPEPPSLVSLGLGITTIAGLAARRRRRRT